MRGPRGEIKRGVQNSKAKEFKRRRERDFFGHVEELWKSRKRKSRRQMEVSGATQWSIWHAVSRVDGGSFDALRRDTRRPPFFGKRFA